MNNTAAARAANRIKGEIIRFCHEDPNLAHLAHVWASNLSTSRLSQIIGEEMEVSPLSDAEIVRIAEEIGTPDSSCSIMYNPYDNGAIYVEWSQEALLLFARAVERRCKEPPQ